MSNIKDNIALSLPKTQARMLMRAGCNPPRIRQNMPAFIIFKRSNSHVGNKDQDVKIEEQKDDMTKG